MRPPDLRSKLCRQQLPGAEVWGYSSDVRMDLSRIGVRVGASWRELELVGGLGGRIGALSRCLGPKIATPILTQVTRGPLSPWSLDWFST